MDLIEESPPHNKKFSYNLSIAIFLSVLASLLTISGNLPLMAIPCGLVIALVGFINPVIGMLLALAIMNNGFGLIPDSMLSRVTYLWDIGFLLMVLYALPFLVSGLKKIKKVRIDAVFYKMFLLFLSVIVISFIWSVLVYQYKLFDTLKAVRNYSGYLAFYIFLSLFYKINSSYKKFFISIYYIVYFLAILYIIQFITGVSIFAGVSEGKEETSGLLRNVPPMFSFMYLYLWYNLAALLSGRELLKGGRMFILVAYLATVFSLTRGLYLTTLFCSLLVVYFLLSRKAIKFGKLILVGVIIILVLSAGFIGNNPFVDRMSSVFSSMSDGANVTATGVSTSNTFLFRLLVLLERFSLAMEKNPILGIGFYHPQYEGDLNLIVGTWEEDRASHALWSADIAWANISYQMGLAGILSLSLFFIAFIIHFPKTTKKNPFLMNDLIGFSIYIEMIRLMVLMWDSAVFTYVTQNIGLLLAFYVFWYQKGISSEEEIMLSGVQGGQTKI